VLGGQVNKEVVELINQAGGKAGRPDGAGRRVHPPRAKMLLPSKENGHIDLGQVGRSTRSTPR